MVSATSFPIPCFLFTPYMHESCNINTRPLPDRTKINKQTSANDRLLPKKYFSKKHNLPLTEQEVVEELWWMRCWNASVRVESLALEEHKPTGWRAGCASLTVPGAAPDGLRARACVRSPLNMCEIHEWFIGFEQAKVHFNSDDKEVMCAGKKPKVLSDPMNS